MSRNAEDNQRPLSEIFPITAKFGGEFESGRRPVVYRSIAGLIEDDSNPNHSHILYLDGQNDQTIWYLRVDDVFNILADAHQKGEVADLTTENLFRLGIVQPK